jgi:hypothetical protein
MKRNMPRRQEIPFFRAPLVLLSRCSSHCVVIVYVLLLLCMDDMSGSLSGNGVFVEGSSSSVSEDGAKKHVLEGIHLPLEKNTIVKTTAAACPTLHATNHATETAAVATAEQQQPSRKLHFNGAGVRSINFFGWDFKVYVASLYFNGSVSPVRTGCRCTPLLQPQQQRRQSRGGSRRQQQQQQ